MGTNLDDFVETSGTTMTIYNDDFAEGDGRFIYKDVNFDVNKNYPAVFDQLQVIHGHSTETLKSHAYVWVNLSANFDYYYQWVPGGEPGTLQEKVTEYVDVPYPDGVIPFVPGATLGFDVIPYNNAYHLTFHQRTPLYLWMQDLFHSDKYSKPWPEDRYAGGQLAAYQYILSKIPGNVPPNKGTIKEKSAIANYPGDGAGFTEAEFASVKEHLLKEIDHFVTVDTWFYPNGIFDAINSYVAHASSNDLLAAAELMSIQPTSNITMILDSIIGDITTLISLIPGYGSAISAVISIAWSTAKLGMETGQSQEPIQASVADMADQLNEYLQYAVNATQTQMNILYKDWGRLQEFSAGVIEGIISEEQFYPSDEPVTRVEDDGSYIKPQGFVTAGANAWSVIIYKSLFVTNHTPSTEMTMSTTVPDNKWNPEIGVYDFTWYLPGTYLSFHGDPVNGYLVFDVSTDAPAEVMQTLFGPQSSLNVQPMSFFAGLQGWYRPTPVVFCYIGHSTNPIVKVGT